MVTWCHFNSQVRKEKNVSPGLGKTLKEVLGPPSRILRLALTICLIVRCQNRWYCLAKKRCKARFSPWFDIFDSARSLHKPKHNFTYCRIRMQFLFKEKHPLPLFESLRKIRTTCEDFPKIGTIRNYLLWPTTWSDPPPVQGYLRVFKVCVIWKRLYLLGH